MLVGARASPLAKAQVAEVAEALRVYHPEIVFSPIYLESTGDKDQNTSLRALGKTDFFTREIDQMLLQGQCRIAIHSAKDLPEPLPKGLTLVALTEGVDPSDALVMRSDSTFSNLPKGARIATSSERREEAVRSLRNDLTFIDLRGTIGERLKKLETGEAEGVVVAEAALIRLGLTHLNRIIIPNCTTQYQGQLAVLAREGDREAFDLFETLDSRKKVLHTGLELPPTNLEARYEHYPLIQIVPRPSPILDITHYTHILFGSKNGVRIALNAFPKLNRLVGIAVGKATAAEMAHFGFETIYTAELEQTEGMIALLDRLDLHNAHLLWPHAATSRPLLREALQVRKIPFEEWIAYDTLPLQLKPLKLGLFDEIHFTSPSGVQNFAKIYPEIPNHLKLKGIGQITELSIAKYLSDSQNTRMISTT